MTINNEFQFDTVINAMLREHRLLQAEVNDRYKEARLTANSNVGRAEYMLIKVSMVEEKMKELEVNIEWVTAQCKTESKWSYKVFSVVTNILTKAVG